MTADLGYPLGYARPPTLSSPDVPTCSFMPGRLPRFSPSLGYSLPATLLQFFPSFPEHMTALSRASDSGLLSYWFGGLVHGCWTSHGRVNGNRVPVFCLPPACLLVLAEIISSTLKMEAICSSETSVATQQTARRHIPEDDTVHNHRCENLKSYMP
jgi:hypothetical protein